MRNTYYEEYAIAFKTLKDIAEFGKKNSGHGYTCYKKAQTAIDEIIKIGDDKNYYS